MLKLVFILTLFAFLQTGLQSVAIAQIGQCLFTDDLHFSHKYSGCEEGDSVHYSGYHNRNLFISGYCDLSGKIFQYEEVQSFDGKKRYEVICNFQRKIIRGE